MKLTLILVALSTLAACANQNGGGDGSSSIQTSSVQITQSKQLMSKWENEDGGSVDLSQIQTQDNLGWQDFTIMKTASEGCECKVLLTQYNEIRMQLYFHPQQCVSIGGIFCDSSDWVFTIQNEELTVGNFGGLFTTYK
jgi:hypothetical protein